MVAPKPAEEGDECPVCMEDISTMPLHELTWCALSCGRMMCLTCIVQCGNHAKSEGKKHQCPLCRSKWSDTIEPVAQKEAPPKRSGGGDNRRQAVCDGWLWSSWIPQLRRAV